MAKAKRSQEKGQARIQELMEMFPGTSRQKVIRADYWVEGLRHTPTLDEIGRWAWPDPHDHTEYDYDDHRQEDLIGNVTHTPKHMMLSGVKETQVMLDARSPYEVRYEGGGRHWLYRDGEAVEEVFFIPRPEWFWKTTSSGKPLNRLLYANFERTIGWYTTTYCEYFKDGNQCLFCALNPTGDHLSELGQERIQVKQEKDVYEAFMIYAQDTVKTGKKLEQINFCSGSFYNRSKETELFLRHIEIVKRAMSDSGYGCEGICVNCGPQGEEDYLKLQEAGVTSLIHNMEVWDPRLFSIICPGKDKRLEGREHWLECLLKAVDVFGWGSVASNLVVGVEMMPPFGFKTEEEAEASLLEGYRFLSSHGVVLAGNAFMPRRGATLDEAPRPRVEYVLRMEQEREKLNKKYDLEFPYIDRPVLLPGERRPADVGTKG